MSLPRLFIQHTPKSGTTSVLNALRTIYGEGSVERLLIPNSGQWNIYIRDPKSEWHTDRDAFVERSHDLLESNFDHLNKIPVLHGHHPYRVIAPLLRETGRKLITFVREPISLAISWFHWDKARADAGLISPHTMEQYLEEGVRNNILNQMLGRDEDYEFIGFSEWLEQDWTFLCYEQGFPITQLLRVNGQPRGYANEILNDPVLLQNIKRANYNDVLEYYRLCKEWRC